MSNISLRQWQKNYLDGKYDKNSVKVMCDAGWYDWFCKDSSLKNRLDKMAKIILQLKDSEKIKLDAYNVWFKNNCPVHYPLYDDFRISDGDENIYVVAMNSEFTKELYGANYVVWNREHGWREPIFKCYSSRELVNWFNS